MSGSRTVELADPQFQVISINGFVQILPIDLVTGWKMLSPKLTELHLQGSEPSLDCADKSVGYSENCRKDHKRLPVKVEWSLLGCAQPVAAFRSQQQLTLFELF